jgi:AhpC/TSA family protein
MSLADKLAAIAEAAKTRIPPEARAVMHRGVEEVRASGILDRVVKVGERAPDFTLPDQSGRPVSLAGLLARGPVVLSFYRGRW